MCIADARCAATATIPRPHHPADKTVRVMLLNLARVNLPPPTTSLPSQIVLWAWVSALGCGCGA